MALVPAGGAVSIFLAAIESRHAGVLADLALGAFTFGGAVVRAVRAPRQDQR